MDIVVAVEIVIPIDHTGIESEGIWHHHGEVFGDEARRCRFYTARKVPDGNVDLSTAVLRVRPANGTFEERLALRKASCTQRHSCRRRASSS